MIKPAHCDDRGGTGRLSDPGELVTRELEEIVGGAQQLPFGMDRGEAAAGEPSRSACALI